MAFKSIHNFVTIYRIKQWQSLIIFQHFMLRSECEHLIRQGILEHIVHWGQPLMATGLYIKLLPYIVYLWKFSGMRTMVFSGGTWMLLMIWYVSRYTEAIRYMYLDTIFNNTIVTRKVLICLSNKRSARVWFEENKMFMTNKTIQLHVVLEL